MQLIIHVYIFKHSFLRGEATLYFLVRQSETFLWKGIFSAAS